MTAQVHLPAPVSLAQWLEATAHNDPFSCRPAVVLGDGSIVSIQANPKVRATPAGPQKFYHWAAAESVECSVSEDASGALGRMLGEEYGGVHTPTSKDLQAALAACGGIVGHTAHDWVCTPVWGPRGPRELLQGVLDAEDVDPHLRLAQIRAIVADMD